MKKTMTTHEIAESLINDQYANWSRNGARALAEYLEELEESTGEEMELDVVAIRCDFSEWPSLQAWAEDYFVNWREDLGIQADEEGEIGEIDEKIREYIHDRGTLIEFDGGIIVSSF